MLFRIMTPCCLVSEHHRLRGTYFPYLHVLLCIRKKHIPPKIWHPPTSENVVTFQTIRTRSHKFQFPVTHSFTSKICSSLSVTY